jgi:hypothetical protein
MIIHNIEEIMDINDIFKCYDKRQKKFLQNKGIQFISINKDTKRYWLYIISFELIKALDDWERRDAV